MATNDRLDEFNGYNEEFISKYSFDTQPKVVRPEELEVKPLSMVQIEVVKREKHKDAAVLLFVLILIGGFFAYELYKYLTYEGYSIFILIGIGAIALIISICIIGELIPPKLGNTFKVTKIKFKKVESNTLYYVDCFNESNMQALDTVEYKGTGAPAAGDYVIVVKKSKKKVAAYPSR